MAVFDEWEECRYVLVHSGGGAICTLDYEDCEKEGCVLVHNDAKINAGLLIGDKYD